MLCMGLPPSFFLDTLQREQRGAGSGLTESEKKTCGELHASPYCMYGTPKTLLSRYLAMHKEQREAVGVRKSTKNMEERAGISY
eukprot:scaffold49799_cov24-Tisochrysis_lutea.AAC.1